MDLVGRKLPLAGGATVEAFFALIAADLDAAGDIAIAGKVRDALAVLERTTMALRGQGTNAVGAAVVDYLRLFALVAYGWMWVRMATAADGDTPQHKAKRSEVQTSEIPSFMTFTYGVLHITKTKKQTK